MNGILKNASVWHVFRKLIDVFFGVYRKRAEILRSAGITDRMSIVDIGCGIGQNSDFTKGKYLGIDFEQEYIDYAKKVYGENENRKFVCADANTFKIDGFSYDAAFLIDFVHHLNDEENQVLFENLNKTAIGVVVICDPIKQSRYNFIGKIFTALDRGKYIRSGEHLLGLIEKNFKIKKTMDLKTMGIEGVGIIAEPRRNTGLGR